MFLFLFMPTRTTHLSRRMNWPLMNRVMLKHVQPTSTVVRVACASMLMAVSGSDICCCCFVRSLALHLFKLEFIQPIYSLESYKVKEKIAITKETLCIRAINLAETETETKTVLYVTRIISNSLDYCRHSFFLSHFLSKMRRIFSHLV